MFVSDFFFFVIIIINLIFIDKRYEFKIIIMKRVDQIESSLYYFKFIFYVNVKFVYQLYCDFKLIFFVKQKVCIQVREKKIFMGGFRIVLYLLQFFVRSKDFVRIFKVLVEFV